MTTLTLRVNTYDKSIEPALGAEPETIAVGETVKLRLLGLDVSAAEANQTVGGDVEKPGLRARLGCVFGDIAMYPFPGDEPAWTEEPVDTDDDSDSDDGETALCCNIDLATRQAYEAVGGPFSPRGAVAWLYIERPVESGEPTLYGACRVRIMPWAVRTPTSGNLPPRPRFPPRPIPFVGGPFA